MMRQMPEEEDDLLPELPGLGAGEDEPFGDDELGLHDDTLPKQEERIGLDDSVGFDDEASLFALELPPEDVVADEEGVDPIPVEGLDGDDEYGWTDDGRKEDEPWEADLDLPGLTPLAGEDGGEEGVDEAAVFGVAGDDVPHLPPLRGHHEGDEDAEDLALGDDMAIAELAELAVLPPSLEGCRAEQLGPASTIACFEPGPPTLAGGADGIFAVRERCERLATRGLDREVVSIAAGDVRIVVGTRRGALRAEDGAAFVPANGWADDGRDAEQTLTVARERGVDRVWALTEEGALFRSDDFGASWVGPLILKTVVALATPPEGGVIAITGGRDASQLARSDDGGQRWAAFDVPPLGAGTPRVAALRDCVVVSSERDPGGPHLSSDRGKTWARVPGLPPTGPVALAWEPGGLALYTAHVVDGRAVVMRHRPGGGEGAVVLDLEESGESRVLALHARSSDGDETVLHVATTLGLFRVHVDPDRAP